MVFGLGIKRKALPPGKPDLEIVRGESYLGAGCTFTGRGFSGRDNLTIHGAGVDVEVVQMTGSVTMIDTVLPSPAARAKDISPDADPGVEHAFPHIAGKSVRIRNSQVRASSIAAREDAEIDETSQLITDRLVCRNYRPLDGSVVRALIAHGDIPDPDDFVVTPAEPPDGEM